MFEKEAEEKSKEIRSESWFKEGEYHSEGYCEGYEVGFHQGAEFGYNKANEWHYVKDGDLPKQIKEYLVYKIDGYGCKSIQVMQFNNQHCWCANCQNEIKAWKEIVLPKESE